MNNFCMIETAIKNEEEVNKIVNKLLDKKLIVSAQVVNSNSFWSYKGNRKNMNEFLVFMKTKKSNCEKINKIIREIHSYELPEFAIFDLTSIDKEYLDWIDIEVEDNNV